MQSSKRHEILRTVFRTTNGRAYQHILEHQNLRIEEFDLRDLEQNERENTARKICKEETLRTFDLGLWPLIRCRALRLANGNWVLVLVMHHIISDGQSFDLMFDELEQLYEEFTGGAKAQLPALPIQYADFASWRRQTVESESIAEQLAYWRERFDGGATVLELPTDKPRPAVQSPSGAKRPLTIPAALCEQLRQIGGDERATLFMVLLAAFNALLYRYSGQAQIAVGTPVSMRNRPELTAAIGLVVNTLVLAASTSGDFKLPRIAAPRTEGRNRGICELGSTFRAASQRRKAGSRPEPQILCFRSCCRFQACQLCGLGTWLPSHSISLLETRNTIYLSICTNPIWASTDTSSTTRIFSQQNESIGWRGILRFCCRAQSLILTACWPKCRCLAITNDNSSLLPGMTRHSAFQKTRLYMDYLKRVSVSRRMPLQS